MSDETTTVETTDDTTTTATVEKPEIDEPRIPRARLNEEATKRKAAEKERDDLRRQLEDRETQGLPELEQLKTRLDKAEKEAERRVQEAIDETKARAKAERLVLSAASRAGFDDPDDVFRYSDIVDLDSIEDADQAERAVKRLAKAKPKLLKAEETTLPGRVLEGGRTVAKQGADDKHIEEATELAGQLKRFLKPS